MPCCIIELHLRTQDPIGDRQYSATLRTYPVGDIHEIAKDVARCESKNREQRAAIYRLPVHVGRMITGFSLFRGYCREAETRFERPLSLAVEDELDSYSGLLWAFDQSRTRRASKGRVAASFAKN